MITKYIAHITLGLLLSMTNLANAAIIRIFDNGVAGQQVLQQIQPTPTTYTYKVDYIEFTANFAPGDVTGVLASVDNLGCTASDYANFSSGSIALIERGSCFFSDKVNFAAQAGAIGVLIYDNLIQPLNNVGVSHPDPTTIPSLFITNSLGQEFRSQIPEPTTLSLLGIGLMGIGYRRYKNP